VCVQYPHPEVDAVTKCKAKPHISCAVKANTQESKKVSLKN